MSMFMGIVVVYVVCIKMANGLDGEKADNDVFQCHFCYSIFFFFFCNEEAHSIGLMVCE